MLKLNAGFSRKVSEPDYGSRGAERTAQHLLVTFGSPARDQLVAAGCRPSGRRSRSWLTGVGAIGDERYGEHSAAEIDRAGRNRFALVGVEPVAPTVIGIVTR